MSNAERQKRYRERNAQSVTKVTDNVTRVTASVTPEDEGALRLECASGAKVTPEDAPQSTNGAVVVAEHPTLRDLCKDKPCRLRKHARAAGVASMSTDELVRRLHFITDWQRSPEHSEVLKRRVGA